MKLALIAALFPIFTFLLCLKIHEVEQQRLSQIVRSYEKRQAAMPVPPSPAPEGSYDDPDYRLGGEKTAFRYITEDEPSVAEIPGQEIVVIRIGNSTLISR